LKNKKERWYCPKENTNVYFSGFDERITIEEIEELFLKCGGIRLDS